MENDASELLWEDEELVLVRRRFGVDQLASVLELRTVATHPEPSTLERLQHEHDLSSLLGADWAIRGKALSRRDGRAYLTLEDPGAELLTHHLGRPWPLAELFPIARALVAALSELHARGIVHGDVRPRNVFVDRLGGRAWLSGFGHSTRVSREQSPLAGERERARSPAYMAPEQTGRLARSLDFRSDLYALGVTLYELLAGRLPFEASTPAEWVQSHLARVPLPLGPEVPSVLASIIERLLAKSREDRYQSAHSLAADLASAERAWNTHGRIEPFALGSRDREGRLSVPRKLYGREHDRSSLIAAFARVKESGVSELVSIAGPSGIGKSALARELESVARSAGAWFASGKFGQYERDKPYAPLAEALAQLVRYVLAQNDLEVARYREALREAVGQSGQLIVDLLPDVELLIGAQPPVQQVSIEDARNRFHVAVERVLAVFARPEHPLVLFIDDLQWLDDATFEMLAYVGRRERGPLLLVLAHRDDERSPLLERALAELEQHPRTLRLHPAPLSRESVSVFLEDALGAPTEGMPGLAELVWEKTAGNPFFATQFLSTLTDDALLAFDAASGSWRWDLDSIQRRGFTENVVDLMIGRLERLPLQSTESLAWLACLGGRAPHATLQLVTRGLIDAVGAALEPAVRAGLLAAGDQGYQFLHDRVQEAAYSRIPEGERLSRHLRIARLLARELVAPVEASDAIFAVVDQFRRAAVLLTDAQERHEVAKLDFAAALRARDAAAHGVALGWLNAAAELLPESSWETDYAFRFELELRRAESLLLTGERELDGLLGALAKRARGPVDAGAVTCLIAGRYVAANQLDLCIDVCVEYLAAAGQDIVRHPGADDVREEYARLRAALTERGVEALIDLPVAGGAEWLAMMNVFESLLPAAAFSDRDMFDWAALRVVNLSIEHGNSVQSAVAYSHMALTLSVRFDDRDLAFRFGEVARALVERPGFERYQVRVLIVLSYHVLPWTGPLWEALSLMRRTSRQSFELGDFTYAGFSGIHIIQLGIASGSPLDEVLADARRELEYVRRAGFVFLVNCHDTLVGLVQALRGEEPPPVPGDAREQAPPEVAIALCWHWSRRMQTAVYFNDYAEALRCKPRSLALITTSKTHYDYAEITFFGGLAEAVAGDVEVARAYQLRYAGWAETSPATFSGRSLLLAAEIARREGRELDAQRLFERAVALTRESGLIHDEALANERAARFHEACGFATAARAFYAAARHCYARWGATGKLRQLDAEVAAAERAPALTGQVGDLDVTTIVEMSRAISGEIDLERMIERLVTLGINHAAATRGLLVLPAARGFRIEAEALSAEARVHFRRASVAPQDLPESILRYVTRALRPVVVDDASKPSPFASDEYLLSSKVRSLFCLPLVKQGKLVGVLYLENALVPGAFTHHRVEVLSLLGSQAAVSLENASLFASLRRAELAQSEAQRLSHTGSFRWGFDQGPLELSDEACRIFDLEPGQPVAPELYFGRVHPDDRARIQREMVASLTQQHGFHAEHRLLLPDGAQKHVRVLAHVVKSGGAESSLELLGAVMDVTASKRAEEAEALAKADLAHATRVTTMGELTASLAHEIKQPLAGALLSAKTCLRWLDREVPDLEAARGTATRMVRDVTRAADIVARIGDMFKKRALPHGSVDINELIRETLGIMRSEASRHGIALRTELSTSLPSLMADRVQIQQVLVNLIVNGIDATKGVESPRELCLSSRLSGTEVVVSVSDTGAGLSSSDADHIFKAFFTTKAHGTGMGLSISRSIVESHGGKLWARPAEGRGAVFWFSLPAGE
jgi:predicted ATPase/signal transduction histidine kinase